MKITFFNTRPHDRRFFDAANKAKKERHEIQYLETALNAETASLAAGSPCVCVFVNDRVDAATIKVLAKGGTRLLALRSAGTNHVDLPAAAKAGMTVIRVPAYSPHAVAEHTIGLTLALNRNIHRAYNRVREGNFALDGLMGVDLYGRVAGVVGCGHIGKRVVSILQGMGCSVLVHDPYVEAPPGTRAMPLDVLLSISDLVTLHCPLTAETRHMIDAAAFERMKEGAILINTSRGALIDTPAAINALKKGKLGALGLDVYEEEEHLFFDDHSGDILQDDVFARLLTFPNVLITGHQAFFTEEALTNIAATTLEGVDAFEAGRTCPNEVQAAPSSSAA